MHLLLSPVAFLRRVAALVPPPRANLVRYFGVFAPNARVRPRVVPAPPPPAPALPETAPCPAAPEPVPKRCPRRPIPWAEMPSAPPADVPVRRPHLQALRGTARRVVAVVLRSTTAQAILETRGFPPGPSPSPLPAPTRPLVSAVRGSGLALA